MSRETYEVSKCLSCGELDCIKSNGDVGYCTECYSVEDYKTIFVDDDNNEVKEEDL